MVNPETQVAAGQVWSLRRCPSRAAVHKVETLDGEIIVHVSVLRSDGEVELGHAPFAHQAFVNSVDCVVATSMDHAEFREGYAFWRLEYDGGAAGIFTIDVCDL